MNENVSVLPQFTGMNSVGLVGKQVSEIILKAKCLHYIGKNSHSKTLRALSADRLMSWDKGEQFNNKTKWNLRDLSLIPCATTIFPHTLGLVTLHKMHHPSANYLKAQISQSKPKASHPELFLQSMEKIGYIQRAIRPTGRIWGRSDELASGGLSSE